MVTQEQNKLIWRTSGETMVVEPWGPNALRVRSVMMGEIEDTDYALLSPEKTACTIETGHDRASITNGKLTAVVELASSGWFRDHGKLTFYNQKGEILFEDIDQRDMPSPRPRHFQPVAGGETRLTCSFRAYEGERFYGMGQYQLEKLDLKGCVLELAQQNTQASVPFAVSSRGYGFFWHNPAVGRVVFGENRTVWTAESARQCDFWVVAGDSPAEIQQSYVRATGLPPMMPEYGLGFWQCKARYWNQDQVLEVARGYRERGVPLDVLVIDFFHWPRMGDFRFDPEFFPDPQGMARELRAMGIEPMVSVWTPIDTRSENFEEMRDRNLLVRVEQGMQITLRFFDGETIYADMTNPDTRAYVWDKLRQNYVQNGIHLFWLDEAEPGYMVYDYGNYRYHLGPALRVGNLYPQLYTRMISDGMRAEGEENPVSLVRCAWAGSQRYGALVWSGDIASTWESFRRQICAGMNMGMAGIPWWTTDIGGFHSGDIRDPAFHELLLRWFQWGTFCPVMRLHGARLPKTDHVNKAGQPILDEGAPNEIWSYGPEMEALLTKFIRIRELIRPYVRALMRTAHETGAPLLRPLFYEFPEDAQAWTCKDEFLFGPDLLVAPVLEPGEGGRRVYLPEGSWTHLFTGETFEGGCCRTVPAPHTEIPVFLRDGRHAEWVDAVQRL